MSGLGVSPVIRPLATGEARRAAEVLFRSADLAYRDINWNHPREDVIRWFTGRVDQWDHVIVAEAGGDICAVMCLEPAMVDQLFVDPDWQGKGIGRALLDQAKQLMPTGFKLYVFQKNQDAVAFYDQYGLRRGKEGVSEDEGEKDFEYHWRPDS